MRDIVLLGLLLVTFAVAVTVHVALLTGFLTRRRWGRALVAFLIPPLAPIWGFSHGMTARSVTWLVAVASYAATQVVSHILR